MKRATLGLSRALLLFSLSLYPIFRFLHCSARSLLINAWYAIHFSASSLNKTIDFYLSVIDEFLMGKWIWKWFLVKHQQPDSIPLMVQSPPHRRKPPGKAIDPRL